MSAFMKQTTRTQFIQVVLLCMTLLLGQLPNAYAQTAPAAGDIIFNEYAADNDANGNDFFELLTLKDGLDLRGLRVSDNEITPAGSTTLNNNESVYIFGNDAFLANIPKGTLIAVYSLAAGIITDVTVNPSANDWKLVLTPGTGVTISVDGLGGTINAGLSNSGDALYAYLPGPDGTSAGTDNIYLDFISYESDGGAEPPVGFADINLPSLADNAFYTGNTAAGNDVVANWTRYDFPPTSPNVPTPGDANPTQDLSPLRTISSVPTLTATPTTLSGFTPTQGIASATQTYTLVGSSLTGNVSVSASTGAEVSTDGTSFSTTATFTPISGTISQPLFARLSATAPTGPFSGTITHSNSGTLIANVTLSGTVSAPLVGRIEITEYAYDGFAPGGEYIELTNVGTAPVDMTGWSFDDSSQQPGSFAIGGFGTVQPGESVIIAENTTDVFRTAWYLPTTVKVVGGNANNLGRSDEINIYTASNTLVDRLTYNDQTLGGPRTQNASAWTSPANLSLTTAASWTLSVVGDAQNSYASVSGNVGNPGGYNIPLNRVLVRETLNSTTVVEGGATDTYTVALNSAPSANVTITINSPGSPLAVNPASLTFTPTNYSTVQTVTVSATDDAIVQGTRSVTLTQSAASTDVAYNGIAINPVSVQISDAPTAQPVSISATGNAPFVNTPTSGPAFVSGVINDPTDPASIMGLNFTLSAATDLTVTASSSNTNVVPNANLMLTGSGASRNLRITPTGVGYATITISASSSSAVGTYVVNFAASAASVAPANSRFHTGTSDASTAIALDATYMLVGDDEDQVIRLYDRTKSGLPLNSFSFNSVLGGNEVDIEGSTRTGNTIYWIGSHGEGGASNRQRLFSTTVSGSGASTSLTFGGSYSGLRTDLINWDAANGHGLGTNYLGFNAIGSNVEAPDGFNFEGFTLAPDGTTAYIGFRAPLEPTANRTQALIVPVTNIAALVAGGGPATFGAPIFLDLGGRSIRSIERNANNEYIIIGGPIGASTDFALFTWTGNAADTPVRRGANLTALNAGGSFETIVEVPTGLTPTTPIQLLLDNGSTVWYNDGTASKDLAQDNFQKFRSDVILLGAAIAPQVDLQAVSIAPGTTTAIGINQTQTVQVVIANNGPAAIPTGQASFTVTIDAAILQFDTPLTFTDPSGLWTLITSTMNTLQVVNTGGSLPGNPNTRYTISFNVRGSAAGTGALNLTSLLSTTATVSDRDGSNQSASGSIVVTSAMPVSLVSFTAKARQNRTVELTWTTSLERNNKGFLIERSQDLTRFEKVGEVGEINPSGNELKNYHLTDQIPYRGTSYYRLTQTDLNGKTTVFPLVSVVLRDEAYGVFPNPVVSDGRFALRLDEPETAIVRFYSADGRALTLQKMGAQSGNLLLRTPGRLAAGVYLLTVEERGQTRQHRLVIE